MTIYTTLQAIPETLKNQIILIGNFDGVHRGHQKLIETANNIASKENKEIILLTFEPHPRLLFRPDDRPFRLTPPQLKFRKLKEFGIKHILALEFNWNFASQSAEDFIRLVIQQGLAAHHVIVGEDFRFGQMRKGTPSLIQETGISTTTLSPEGDPQGQKFSSSMIRQALRQGDIQTANHILGWEWEIIGTVAHGDKRGREIGYPTANVPLKDTLHPAYGIYACWAQIENTEKWWPAAVNIGIRPMFELEQGQVEAHILDGFDQDIYDLSLRIKPVMQLRGEAKFSSLDELIHQIGKDCKKTLSILSA